MGESALAGQPGVLDVVKAIRRTPFAEYVVAFYDPEKTKIETLLTRLKSNGCDKAERVKAVDGVENPVTVVGDFIQINTKLDVTAPDGWKVLKNSDSRVDVQTPAKAKPGKYSLTIGETKVEVQLVERVK